MRGGPRLRTASAALASLGLALYLGSALAGKQRRAVFLPGATSAAHYQIELACESCHTRSFASAADFQKACMRCHGEELERARDSHPRSKFTDPRNAEYVAILDARECIACHREHRPGATLAMDVTLPADLCWNCHKEVGKERPSHAGLAFDSCARSGCHNFHDNRALYEDFLIAHLNEPDARPGGALLAHASAAEPAKALRAEQQDAPAASTPAAGLVAAWAASSHAGHGVNCSDCHGGAAGSAQLDHGACRECHEGEVSGFLRGRHGMRLAAGLGPMRPGLARLPMKADAAQRELGCASCHDPHRVDTRAAAVTACLECHDDAHSRAYPQSPHAALWQAEGKGELAPGRGVSCASCHLPRSPGAHGGTVADHDQSGNLHPSEEMARVVCSACHGLQFSFDALADADLVRRNFAGRPARSVESFRWVEVRAKNPDKKKGDHQ